MADIDQIIAGGAGSSSRADFSGIGTLLDSYWSGLDQRAKNDLRDAFKPTAANPNGVPMANGQIDIPTVAKTLFQKGDIAGGTALLGQAQSAGERAAYSGIQPQAPQAQAPIAGNPPSSNRAASTVVAPPLNRGGANNAGDQPGSIVGMVSSAGIPDELAGPVIQQVSALTKTDPNAALDPQVSQRVQQVIQAAAQRIKSGGQAPQQAMPQQAPQQPPQMQPTQQPPAINIRPQPQGFQPSPEQVAAQNDPELKRLRFMAASPDKATAEAARVELKSYYENRAPTNPMKEAGASGLSFPAYQQRQGELASEQAGATERAKNDVAEQQTYIDQGRQAATRLGTLNLMTNIIQSDKNLDLGFGSPTTLKIKMALERAGIDTGDLSGSQLLGKYNSILAAESTKGITSRGTNFDMKTFMANNPGLGMDEKGNIRMLGILSQNAKREYELGKLARQNQDNWSNWDSVVENYDKTHQIKDPTTGKVLSTNSIIAPKQASSTPATFANKQFASPEAARAAGAKAGDIVTDATGKQWRLK